LHTTEKTVFLSEVMASDAQKTALINHQSMEKKTKTIRLIYPQWQGASIVPLIPEVKNPDDASRGYFLGAQLLNFLAPDSGQETLTVPVSIELEDRQVTDGVLDRDIIVRQTRTALDMLRVSNPDKIVTLGGECSVSVVPFTYLAEKYDNDVAVIWIDAHPDITLPGDVYPGYHAMAVTACMGYGDKRILEELPAKIFPSKILLVGLRNWERDEIKERQQQYGIKHLSPQDVAQNSDAIKSWLKACGASKVVIHFDMDALDPTEIIAAVGTDPDGMKMEEVIRVINDIAAEKELVGLTIAEPMPRTAIRIKNMLNQLPLLK
jgi:arginase